MSVHERLRVFARVYERLLAFGGCLNQDLRDLLGICRVSGRLDGAGVLVCVSMRIHESLREFARG